MTPATQPLPLKFAIPLSIFSGVLYFTGFAGFDQWYLMFFSLVPLLVAIDGASVRRAVLLGWLMGLVTHLGGYYWVVGMLAKFSGFPLPLCILFTVLLCAYQGGTFAVFAAGVARMQKGGWEPFFAGAAMLVAVEWLYPVLFPSYMGNALYVHPVLVQTADLGGVTLVSFLLAAINFAGLHVVRYLRFGRNGAHLNHAMVALGLWVAAIVYGTVRIPMVDAMVDVQEKTRVGIVQVNMGIFEKRGEPLEGLRRHQQDSLELEREHDVDLLVWPESSVVYTLPTRATNLKHRVLGKVRTPTVFGAVRSEITPTGEKIYNTAYIVDGNGQRMGYYDKVYRLAFGEYLPLGDTFPILYEWSPNSGHFHKGEVRTPLPFGEHRLGTLICYEDILPRYVNSLMRAVDPPPDILVNITNDSWFGDTTEPWIHLALSTVRSVEHRRWLVRATNSGVSAFVDPAGRITRHTPVMQRASIVEDVTFHETRTVYSRVGWIFQWVCILAVAAMMVFRKPVRGNRSSKKKKKKKKKK